MSQADEETVRRVMEEVFNKGNLAVIDEVVDANYVEHNPMPDQPAGLPGLKAMVNMLRTAFPDLQMPIEDLFSTGDRVVIRGKMTGTHKGEFMGTPPSGNKIDAMYIDIVRFANGKAVEHWGLMEEMTLAMQTGMLPHQ